MSVCEQLTKMYKGREITSLSAYYEIHEFKDNGQVLLYDNIMDQFVIKELKDIAKYDLVED